LKQLSRNGQKGLQPPKHTTHKGKGGMGPDEENRQGSQGAKITQILKKNGMKKGRTWPQTGRALYAPKEGRGTDGKKRQPQHGGELETQTEEEHSRHKSRLRRQEGHGKRKTTGDGENSNSDTTHSPQKKKEST